MSTVAVPAPKAGTLEHLTRWRVLFGAIVIQLILGTVYGYSIFWQPLEAYVFPQVITQSQQTEMVASGQSVAGLTIVADEAAAKSRHDAQKGLLRYAFGICISVFALVMVIAGRVQDVRGPRFTALVGAGLMGGGFLLAGLMSRPIVFHLAHAVATGAIALCALIVFHTFFGKADTANQPIARYGPLAILSTAIVGGVVIGNAYVGRVGELDRLLLLWGTVGLLAGAGIGFAYVCPIAALIKWFPEHKGLVSGIAVAGFGFGSYILSKSDFSFGGVAYIEQHGITRFFLVHGIVSFVAITFGALLLSNPPGTQATAKRDSSWQEMVRKPAFYLLWSMFFSGALAGLTVIGVVKDFAGEQLVSAAGVTDTAAVKDLMMKGAAALGSLAVFNAIGRIVWGLVSDRVGRTGAFVAMFVVQAVMMFVLPMMRTEASIAIAACVVGFNFGGNFALFPSATADLFGAKNLGANYGFVFTSYGAAGVVGIFAGNLARSLTGSYAGAFAAAGALCLLSSVLAVTLHRSQRAPAQA